MTTEFKQETKNEGPGQAVSVKLIGFDKPFFTAVAIALALGCMLYCYQISNEVVRMEYWLQRNEAFLEQISNQGVHVPPDLLHKEK